MTTDHDLGQPARPLARPDEPIFDQGLTYDLGTLIDRRRMITSFALGAATIGLAACGGSAVTSSSSGTSTTGSGSASSSTRGSSTSAASGELTEIPEETAGPYPGDGSNGPDVLEESGVVRSDIRSSFGDSTTTAEGVPMTLELTVLDIVNGGAPMAGAAVYAWHCNRDGGYSMYSNGITNENYLRGVQITDDSGKVSFTSIFPGCYSGRWPHIHFEVYPDQASITDARKVIATSQVALPQNTCEAVYATSGYEASVSNLSKISLTSDNVFGNDGGIHQLGTTSGDVTSGYAVALTVPIDTTT